MGDALKAGATHLLALDIPCRSSLTGSRGPIWLIYLPDPQARENLSGTWEAYSDTLRRIADVQIPGTARAMFLKRTVLIDAAHRGHNVVVSYEATGGMLSLMINGRLLNHAEQVRAHSFSFNVTPMIAFGGHNVIELAGSSGSDDTTIQLIEIRYYYKGVYP